MTLPDLIEIRPDVMAGKPCLKGTRIPVYLILEKMGRAKPPNNFSPFIPRSPTPT